jgi:hypothetical protein
VLVLSNDDVQQVLQMSDGLAILRRFFEEDASGRVLTRHRSESWLLLHDRSEAFYQCKSMEGGVPIWASMPFGSIPISLRKHVMAK